MTEHPRPHATLAIVLACAAIVAGVIAEYLAFVAFQQHGLPVGCGDSGGCAEVLSSRWSSVIGFPVSLFAVLLYGVVFLAAVRWPDRWVVPALRCSAVALVMAAIWFVSLQAFVLRAYCVWCMVEHGLGLIVAGLAWKLSGVGKSALAVSGRSMSVAGWLGALGVAGLAVLQLVTDPPSTTNRLPQEATLTADGDAVGVTLLNGRLRLSNDEPMIGPASADRTLYLMYDYCCPHCRRTHEYLLNLMRDTTIPFNIVCLPMPRDADCNAAITSTESRFENACELAALALAVWGADPAAFAEFDQWLFQPSRPPDLADARDRAAQLVTADRLAAVAGTRSPSARIERNVDAYNASDANYLPVLMAPNMETIVGRPESEQALRKMLQDGLLN